jgi:VanZ family protein
MTLTRLWWAVGFVLVGLVIFVCLLPGQDLPATPFSDKYEHFIAHFVLAAWFAGLVPRRRWWLLLVGLVALGSSIEVAQGLMNLGREADVRDELANFVGNVGGLGASWLGLARWPEFAGWLFGRRTA